MLVCSHVPVDPPTINLTGAPCDHTEILAADGDGPPARAVKLSSAGNTVSCRVGPPRTLNERLLAPELTEISTAACASRKLAGMLAVNWVALTKTVGSGALFHRMLVPGARNPPFSWNPEPLTVKVKPGPPTGAEAGLMLLIAGAGAGAAIMNSTLP